MQELWSGVGSLVLYFVILALSAVAAKFTFKIPHEVFRKTLHLILLGSLFVFIFCFDTWWISAASSISFAVIVYPLLVLGEKIKGYSELLEERKSGEIKSSLLIVFTMFSIVITVCWGFLGDRLLALASICAWGFGDAAAALIGKKYGRHPLEIRRLRVRKSWEGTLSMFAVSFVSVYIILSCRGGFTSGGCIITALITATVSAIAELITSGGNDTITCPLSAMAVLIPFTFLLGGGL